MAFSINTVIYFIWTFGFDTALLSLFLEVTQLVNDGWALNNKTYLQMIYNILGVV